MSEQLEFVPVRTTHADVLLASAGERGVLCDFYDEDAADIYRDILHEDSWEAGEYTTRIRPASGPVLELGAGTGRLTFPLLSHGWEMTVLELSSAMRALFEGRLADAPTDQRDRCTVVAGDMSDFALGKRFGTVVISPGTINLLDTADRPGLYASVRDHLEPGGRFLLGVPDAVDAEPESLERSQEFAGASGRRYVLHARLVPAEEISEVTIYPADRSADPFVVCTSRVRGLTADQVVRELGQAGFDVVERAPLVFAGGRHQDVLLVATVRSDPS
ncbi:daptide-type RiPP biosynthesis methyltransferase [Umezawaea endophytica]|uniref:Class I SAM-dependent methyltransferase n=1 Tax=Umezawaea endophytica TaxID=1654476 RepID=A0A9X2VJU3_9PSEU|nr:daptide-type RiPP biosynthesis methyltransferase [Umezawaea endophytica]MCS7477851.1 class I SAM-dependent methyltransferase [Umezawaea endophytica]